MAVLTLDQINANLGFAAVAEVKITRVAVGRTVLLTSIGGRSNAWLEWLFNLAARDLPRAPLAPDWYGFERELIRERTQAGLSSARARGRVGKRPKGLSPQAEATAMVAETLYRERRLSVNAIAKKLNVSKGTLYRFLRHRGVEIGAHERQSH